MSSVQKSQTQNGSSAAPNHGSSSVIGELVQLNNHLSKVLGSILIAPCDETDLKFSEYAEAVLTIKNLTELMHIEAAALPHAGTTIPKDEQACRLNEHPAGVFSGKSSTTSGEKEPTFSGDEFFDSAQTPNEGPSTGQAAKDQVGAETILPETEKWALSSVTSNGFSIKYALWDALLHRRRLTASSTIQRNSGKLDRGKISLLLDISYDVRRVIYSFYYQVNQNIQLTDGPPEWNSLIPRRAAYSMSTEGLILPLTCRQLNFEVVRLIYGTNNFLLTPGEGASFTPKVLSQPRANTDLFLSNLRLETKQTIRCLQLCLGPALRWKMIRKLVRGLSGISRVVITVDPLNLALLKPVMKGKQRQCIREACRKIAVARAGLPLQHTLWDDCGDAATGRMLDSVLSKGYCRAT